MTNFKAKTLAELEQDTEKHRPAEEDADDDGSCISAGGDEKLEQRRLEIAETERKSLAQKETRAVNCLRVIVFFVLAVTAVLVCLGVFFYTRNDEIEDFEYVFESSAKQVIESFHGSVSKLLAGVDSFSVAITAYALDTGATFPNVTVPYMELRGANTRVLTKSVASTFFPIITEDDRAGFESYAVQQQTQKMVQRKSFQAENELIARQDASFGLETSPFVPPSGEENPLLGKPFSPVLSMMNGSPQPPGTGPYLPFWQTSPVIPAPVFPTLNILTFPPLGPGVKKVMETSLAYLSNAVEPAMMFNIFLARGQYRHEKEKFQGDAVTPLIYPIFDSFSPDRSLVGITLSNIYWRLHFENILPPSSRGIVAVLANNANQTFTYQLDGEDVTFLGLGDLHDETFDKYEVSADITTYMAEHASVRTQGLTAVPLTSEGVQYFLRVYPSKDMESLFVTNKPVIFAVVVGAVFLFTSIIFVIYNILVERRQQIVVERAVKSSAVVSSLFPEQIKEQIINNSAPNPTKDQQKIWNNDGKKKELNGQPKARPMASKYPETTIMFAGKLCNEIDRMVRIVFLESVLIRLVPFVDRHCWFHFLEFNSRTRTSF